MIKTRPIAVPDDYLELIHRFPLRKIRHDREGALAVSLAHELMAREAELSEGESDYLEALSHFVGEYEQSRYMTDAGDPLERLRFLVEESGLGRAGLAGVLGCQSAATMALSGQRELSKSQIRKLTDHFKIDAGYFL